MIQASLCNQSRTWPFTIRISLAERQLLRLAANRKKTSRAEIARTALDPLFSELASEGESPRDEER